MTKWQSPIPKKPKLRDRKRCFRVYRPIGRSWAGGKVVWLTDKEMTLAYIKYPKCIFDEVLERDSLQELKKYMHQTIE